LYIEYICFFLSMFFFVQPIYIILS